MSTTVVDCKGINSKEEFWAHYVSVVKPHGAEFFGRNLDAFWDALDGGGPGFPEQDSVHFINTDDLKLIESGKFYDSLCEIAREARFGGASVVFD